MHKFSVEPPIVQSAMSGYSTPTFCQKMLSFGVGMALLGAYAFDKKMLQASSQILKRGRLEFILPEGVSELEKWVKERFPLVKRDPTQLIGINIRIAEISDLDMITEKMNIFLPYIDVIELNAHCRQQEVTIVGGSQALLKDLEKLESIIQFLREKFSSKYLGIKVRGVAIEDIDSFCDIINSNELSYIHVDCMIPGQNRADLRYIEQLHERTNVAIIGNNSVRTIEDIKTMLFAGASAVSIARPLIREPEFIKKLIRLWEQSNFSSEGL